MQDDLEAQPLTPEGQLDSETSPESEGSLKRRFSLQDRVRGTLNLEHLQIQSNVKAASLLVHTKTDLGPEPAQTDLPTKGELSLNAEQSEGFVRQISRNSESSLAPVRVSAVHSMTEEADFLQCLSVVSDDIEEASQGHTKHRASGPNFPCALMALVIIFSTLAGFVCVGFSTAVIYAGCPLGINGCNEFYNKEDKAYKLIKALKGSVPEEIVYIIVAALGALVVVQLTTRLPVELAFQIRGGGTVQSLEAVAVGYVIPLSAAPLRLLASVIYSGSGGPLGMEGPVIQICTILVTNVGWTLGIRAAPTQSVLASLGFACGFAASFNSPLAGILFAVEKLQHVTSQFSRGMEVLVLVVSIAPTIVYRACKGNSQHFYPRYGEEIEQGTSGGSLDQIFGEQLWMLIAIPIAILCSFVNLLIILGLRHLNAASEMLHRRFRWLPLTVTFIFQAILVASLGVLAFRITGLRGIWGIGAESVQKALSKEFEIYEYFLFGFAKCLAMVIAVVWRAPGDVLEPVLITGAFVGGGVGRCLMVWCGLGIKVMTPSIIFGMVGLFASSFRFPLTPVVIVLELMGTEAYMLIIPMVLASFTAVILSSRLCHPILAEIMEQDGISLHGHKAAEFEEEEAAWASEEGEGPELDHTFSKQDSGNKGFGATLGGMFAESIKTLSTGTGLSNDYEFNQGNSPRPSEVPPWSPTTPKTPWGAEPTSGRMRRQRSPGSEYGCAPVNDPVRRPSTRSNEQDFSQASSSMRRQKSPEQDGMSSPSIGIPMRRQISPESGPNERERMSVSSFLKLQKSGSGPNEQDSTSANDVLRQTSQMDTPSTLRSPPDMQEPTAALPAEISPRSSKDAWYGEPASAKNFRLQKSGVPLRLRRSNKCGTWAGQMEIPETMREPHVSDSATSPKTPMDAWAGEPKSGRPQRVRQQKSEPDERGPVSVSSFMRLQSQSGPTGQERTSASSFMRQNTAETRDFSAGPDSSPPPEEEGDRPKVSDLCGPEEGA